LLHTEPSCVAICYVVTHSVPPQGKVFSGKYGNVSPETPGVGTMSKRVNQASLNLNPLFLNLLRFLFNLRNTYKKFCSQAHKRTSSQVHKRTSSQVHKRTSSQAHKRTSSQVHKRTSSQVHKRTSSQAHKCISAQAHKRMRLVGWTNDLLLQRLIT
jgi:hypothetical protein